MYIRFLNGWQDFGTQCMRVNFLSYSEIVDGGSESLRRKLDESGFDCAYADNSSNVKANINIGCAGRGKEELSGSQIEEIKKKCEASSVPWVLEPQAKASGLFGGNKVVCDDCRKIKLRMGQMKSFQNYRKSDD